MLREIDPGYFLHVADLEEWNEDAGFVWGPATLVVSKDVVTVIHPHTYPGRGEVVDSTAIAVYTLSGDRVALHVTGNRESSGGLGHNYWAGGTIRVHAWLTIEPVGKEVGYGTQRKFSGADYPAIHTQMVDVLRSIGWEPQDFVVRRGINTGGELVDPTRSRSDPEHDGLGDRHPLDEPGLRWGVYPCYPDGRNVDVDPVEPRGE